MATKVVKAKVKKVRVRRERKKRSKGARHPWEVWGIDLRDGRYTYENAFDSKGEADAHIGGGLCRYLAPVIVHIDIPSVEYSDSS